MTNDHGAEPAGTATEDAGLPQAESISIYPSNKPGFSYAIQFPAALTKVQRNAILDALTGLLDPGTTYQFDGYGLTIFVIPDSDDANDEYTILQRLRELLRPTVAHSSYAEVSNHTVTHEVRLTVVGGEPVTGDEVFLLLQEVSDCISVGISRGRYVMTLDGQATQATLISFREELRTLGIDVEFHGGGVYFVVSGALDHTH